MIGGDNIYHEILADFFRENVSIESSTAIIMAPGTAQIPPILTRRLHFEGVLKLVTIICVYTIVVTLTLPIFFLFAIHLP